MARAPRNRTVQLNPEERPALAARLRRLEAPATLDDIRDATFCQDFFSLVNHLPECCIDLLFVDPPYNLSKRFGSREFRKLDPAGYQAFLRSWLVPLLPRLKPDASIYVCADWRSSGTLQTVCSEYLCVQNRITWEREKGRGARRNWKNVQEDIWFCTVGRDYYFDVDAVKQRRPVIAPYRVKGRPKDWVEDRDGNYRLTHPGNLWKDLTVPFWSMPENTEHPAQKPEKLLARIILASCPPGGLVFDPFLGSGTTSVAARKLGRHYCGVEVDEGYCCLAEKRLSLAAEDTRIQGYAEGVFWPRNHTPPAAG